MRYNHDPARGSEQSLEFLEFYPPVAMLPEQFVLQVQQAVDIVDLIGSYVTLKKRGKDYTGLCPFHQEKTPSFSVSASKQIFKCFGCGAGGGVFQFVMLQQKMPFPEAVRFLADKAGIRMPTEDLPTGEAALGRSELTKVMAFAAGFFRQQLRSAAGREAMEYAAGRQLTEASLARFGIGYAPDSWDSLSKAARQEGFSEAQLSAAGLIMPRENGRGGYDRFRNRLMFPIADAVGKVIAFGGRALAKNERAKYLNSPETSLFDKSSNLYGLNLARQAISDSGCAIVVEGYFDAILPSQFGVENVVASLGTALTDRHVRMLSRLANDVVLVFDSDKAGEAASERALELFLAQQVNVRVAAVPDGKDPCDYVLSAGGDSFRKLTAEAPDALEYMWKKRSAQFADSGTLVDRRLAAEDFLRIVLSSAAYGAIDAVRKGLLMQKLAHLLGLPAEQLQEQMRRMSRSIPNASGGAQERRASQGAGQSKAVPQRLILEVLVACPDEFEHAARYVGIEDFDCDPLLRAVAQEVWRLGNEGSLSLESLLGIQADQFWGRIVTDLASAGDKRGNFHATLSGALEMIERQRKLEEMAELRHTGDDEALRKLTEKLRQPDPRRRPAIM